MTRVFRWAGVLAMALAGCGVEPLDEEGPSATIPPVVQESLNRSCASMGSCHQGDQEPDLRPGASGEILSRSNSDGIPYVVLGDVEGSYLARLLRRVDVPIPMPPDSTLNPEQEQDVAVILGWIAGAPLTAPGGDEDDGEDIEDDGEGNGDDAGDTTGSPGSTSNPGSTSSPGSTTDASGDTADEAFAPIQDIFTAKCAGPTCHNIFPPQLTEGMAYDNIVNENSTATTPYVTPGDPEESHLWRRINGPDYGLPPMPPVTNPPLTDDEFAAIEAWITDGAMR